MATLEEQLSMSSVAALAAIRGMLDRYPDANALDAAKALRTQSADLAAVDFDNGLALHEALPQLDISTGDEFYRELLDAMVSLREPGWLSLVPLGRNAVYSALSANLKQVFDAARLWETPPCHSVLLWWDRLAARVRQAADLELVDIGRSAERLTLEHERERMRAIGIEKEPIWVSIEDNSTGYDVISFTPGTKAPMSKLIEVKGTLRDSPVFYLTRSEWNAAVTFENAFVFHVWNVLSEQLRELAPVDIYPHVPLDAGRGLWQEVKIELDEGWQ